MVADSDLPYFRGYARQRGRGFGALAQTIGRTANPFLRRYVVPATKRVGADLTEMAGAEIGNVLIRKKKLKSVAADVGKKTLQKQLGAAEQESVALFLDQLQKSVDVVEQEKIYLLI